MYGIFGLHFGHVEDTGENSVEHRSNAINPRITTFMALLMNPKGRFAIGFTTLLNLSRILRMTLQFFNIENKCK